MPSLENSDGRERVQPSLPFVMACHVKNVSPSREAMASVAMARYRPRRRTEIAPASTATGTVHTAANGMASQNGHPHDAMATAVIMDPIPAKL